MKKVTYETRIRMHIDLNLGTGNHPENITMTASAWNTVSSVYNEAASRLEQLGMPSMARRYRETSNQIFKILELRGYYND